MTGAMSSTSIMMQTVRRSEEYKIQEQRSGTLSSSVFSPAASIHTVAVAAGTAWIAGMVVDVSETLSALWVARPGEQRRKPQELVDFSGILESSRQFVSRQACKLGPSRGE